MRMQTTNTVDTIRHLAELDSCIQQMHDALRALEDEPNDHEQQDLVRECRDNLAQRQAMARVEVERLFQNATGLLAEGHGKGL